LLPATGPVSAGGDQGKDFETYTVGDVMPIGAKPNFFARASSEKVVFACSLEKKRSEENQSRLESCGGVDRKS
jgi:hypothetical protein